MTQIYNNCQRFVLILLLTPILFFLHPILFFSQMTILAGTIGLSQPEPDLNLFSYIEETNLTNRQASQLAIYRSDRTTRESRIIRVQTDLLERGDQVSLNLLQNQNVALDRVRIEKRAAQDYSWFGNSTRTQDNATLVVKGNDIVGTIHVRTQLYSIRPIGNGLQALILVNQSAFPPD